MPAEVQVVSRPFVLASAPVNALERAIQIVREYKGHYCAGDKDDIFNSMTLNSQESWKVGWKGKVESALNIVKTMHPSEKVWVIAIAGGPACDWERGELRNTFMPKHPTAELKVLGDFDDFKEWCDKNFKTAKAPTLTVMDRLQVDAEEERQTRLQTLQQALKFSRWKGPCADCCKVVSPLYCPSEDGQRVCYCVLTSRHYVLPMLSHMILCPHQGFEPCPEMIDNQDLSDGIRLNLCASLLCISGGTWPIALCIQAPNSRMTSCMDRVPGGQRNLCECEEEAPKCCCKVFVYWPMVWPYCTCCCWECKDEEPMWNQLDA